MLSFIQELFGTLLRFENFEITRNHIPYSRENKPCLFKTHAVFGRFLDALIFEHFENLYYILANFNVFNACLLLKYTFKIYCYAFRKFSSHAYFQTGAYASTVHEFCQ